MTNTITYPAAYHVLSCDEMTYTEGGVGVVQAVMAWFPLYGWYKAVSTIHDYRKANINSNWVENGMNALVVHAEKSSLNTILCEHHRSGAQCTDHLWLLSAPCISLNKQKAAAPSGWKVPPPVVYDPSCSGSSVLSNSTRR